MDEQVQVQPELHNESPASLDNVKDSIFKKMYIYLENTLKKSMLLQLNIIFNYYLDIISIPKI